MDELSAELSKPLKNIFRHFKKDKTINDAGLEMHTGHSDTRLDVGKAGPQVFVDTYTKKNSLKKSLRNKQRLFHFASWSKVTWACSLILTVGVIRLGFVNHGIYDYWVKSRVISDRAEYARQLFQENKQLENEIIRLSTDHKYLKFLVREHLGLIAKDEYLILFSPRSANQAK
jgi:cell division protein FtsB